MKSIFSELIGQNAVKKRLSFYHEAYQKTGVIPSMLFSGQKGIGKSQFAKSFSEGLKRNSSKKDFLPINCSSIKSLDFFIEEIYAKQIRGRNISLLLDEAHCLPDDLTYALLSILDTDNFKNRIRIFSYKGDRLVFDFSRLNIIFATTESNKVFIPLKDRLTLIDFESYSEIELSQIVLKNISKVKFSGSALEKIAQTIRNNARNAVMRSNEIQLYCNSKNIKTFNEKSFEDFLDKLGILPYGLTNSELQILQLLAVKERSLQSISASTGMSRGALQYDHEMFLLQRGLIEIDGKRKITLKGREILDKIIKNEY
jgi:Holliday junction resolvasome RuvABC ATP-dependent DNA helicase subunit